MTTAMNSTESNKSSMPTPPTNSGYTETKPEGETLTDETPQEETSNIDDFGYEKTESEEKPVESEEKPVESDEKQVEKPATGYGEDEVAEEEKPTEEPKEEGEKTPEALKEEEVKTTLGELPEGYNKELASKFALENNMSKEQLEAYVKLAKEESTQLKADQEAQIKSTRKQWKNELMNDPNFGGELFDKNVDRVEKILDKHMPNMKKVLTDKGSMLPPYIMKDLLGLSKILNPTTNLVNGDPSKVESKEENFLDVMYK